MPPLPPVTTATFPLRSNKFIAPSATLTNLAVLHDPHAMAGLSE
jgi:hypothetical protein